MTFAVTAVKAGDNEFANSLKHLVKLAKVATAVTAVKAGDNEFTLNDGIKYLSNVDVVMKLRCSCQQLVTAVKIVNSL